MSDKERAHVVSVESATPASFGSFVVEPLDRGFGITLGNSLRRILLSSLPGAAVTSIRIDGVLHEFSIIPGVVEDVTEVVLNIKEMAVRLNSELPKSLLLTIKGPCELCAGDFSVDSEVEICNPELHIATLNQDAKVTIELTVEHGRGYQMAERNKKAGMPIGVIPVDSIFTPVKRVNFKVENTRVGQQTDYDRLLMDIWTNGALSPSEAVRMSAAVLSQHLSLFSELDASETPQFGIVNFTAGNAGDEQSIEELELSVRSYNSLRRAGINTIQDLTSRTENEMMKVRNLGRKSLDEVIARLEVMGLTFRSEE